MKVSVPKGTRDFLPLEVLRRNYIFQTVEGVFKKYGFAKIETPVMENLSTLTGKYGDEGDRLIFKILNNGDYLAKADQEAIENRNSSALTSSISKRGLRYDLTVPFARFVVQHQNELNFPFKRYQIQPVWRADRPQKGRYQEFYQCDVDVVGSDSLIYEAECICIFQEVFKALGLEVEIVVNHRKILAGIANAIGKSDELVAMTVAIDKLDKIGWEKVSIELSKAGFEQNQIDQLKNLLTKDLQTLATEASNPELLEGIHELQSILQLVTSVSDTGNIKVDFNLARGLGYYTGCIFEVKSKEVSMGSIAAGGRYANLTEIFGLPNLSGIGISFGADRIYDVLLELDRFPTFDAALKPVLFVALDSEQALHSAFMACQSLRKEGILCDLYPQVTKLKKALKYANLRGLQKVILIGSTELDSAQFSLKHMETGTQELLDLAQLIAALKDKPQ